MGSVSVFVSRAWVSNVVVWEVEVITRIDAFLVCLVVVVNSYVCCEAYILLFTFLTCD